MKKNVNLNSYKKCRVANENALLKSFIFSANSAVKRISYCPLVACRLEFLAIFFTDDLSDIPSRHKCRR